MFQHILGQVLESCDGAYNISDDIIVGGRDQNDHDERLMAVLATLEDNGLTINAEKSVFRMSKLRYMGHELSEKGLSVDNSKVRAVLNCAPPKSASELRSFLGLAQYCAKLLPNFSTISDPLWKLTRADTEYMWNIEQQKAFDSIKAMMTSAPVLVYHSLGAKTRLTTDASPVGLGAVLIAGTLGCVFIDNETHESGVTKCTTGEAWSAFSWHHSSVFHCQWTHNQVFLLLSHMLI